MSSVHRYCNTIRFFPVTVIKYEKRASIVNYRFIYVKTHKNKRGRELRLNDGQMVTNPQPPFVCTFTFTFTVTFSLFVVFRVSVLTLLQYRIGRAI